MSFYSNRALYRGDATDTGRGLFSPATGRMLWAGPSWFGAIRSGAARRPLQYINADSWNLANYNQDQVDSMSQLRSSNWTMLSPFVPVASASWCTTYYGYYTVNEDCAAYYYFTLPTGARGTIKRACFRASAGGCEAWNASPSIGSSSMGGNYLNTAWADFGQSAKLYFYADYPSIPGVSTMLDGTPPWGLTVPFSTINAFHVANGSTFSGYDDGYMSYPWYTIADVGGASLVAWLNSLTSDSFYLALCVTRPSLHPYLCDPATNAVNDFTCQCYFDSPQMLITI